MSKSQPPTAARLRRAFSEGDVPLSSMAVRTAALLAVVAASASAVHAIRTRFVDRLHAALTTHAELNPAGALADVAVLAGPALALAAVLALSAGLLQTRGATTLGAGARTRGRRESRARLWNGRRAARAVLGAVTLVSILAVTLGALRQSAPDVARALPSTERALDVSEMLFRSLALPVLGVLVAATVVDVWLEHRFWLARLRMSPREIKDERREQEGEPLVRRARRRAHEELAREARPPKP